MPINGVSAALDGFPKREDPHALRREMEEKYLQLCQEVFLELQHAETWPWPDSPNPEDLVESSDT